MVYFMENPYERMDDLGGKKPLFLGWHPYVYTSKFKLWKDNYP